MPEITIRSFVKINLSIDVGPRAENGFHAVDMVMQQLAFHDDVKVEYTPSAPGPAKVPGAASHDKGGSFDIEVRTNRYYLPTDRRNLAYQAAEVMADLVASRSGDSELEEPGTGLPCIAPGRIVIDIKKRIPVSGGLAGGSGNGAAVLHALNILWDLHLSLKELMDLGAKLGSDVPFCVIGQAREEKNIPAYLKGDPMASSCARATGRGTDLEIVTPLKAWMVIAKPKLSVSTAEVYKGIDELKISERPDNDRLVKQLTDAAAENRAKAGESCAAPSEELYRDFINVLEEYTLRAYPVVAELKDRMKKAGADFALMSGSGPTVFGIFSSMKKAENAAEEIQRAGLEAYWTRTTL